VKVKSKKEVKKFAEAKHISVAQAITCSATENN
jgi:hypothetical protein